MVNFRKYEQTAVVFGKNTNILYGENGSGKTTVLEAIHSLAYTRSFKTRIDGDLIRHGQTEFQLKGQFLIKKELTDHVRLKFSASKKKKIDINDQSLGNRSEIIGKYPVVALTPEDSNLTFGAPEIRRQFFNKLLSQVDKGHLDKLQIYQRLLKQRNAMLAENISGKNALDIDLLEAIDEQRVLISVEIHETRKKYIQEFKRLLYDSYKALEQEKSLKMAIIHNVSGEKEELASAYEQAFINSRDEDLRRGTTTRGPHRDHFVFYLNKKDLRKFGSQGEHKLVLVAIKFAEGQLLEEKLSEPPVFLLDDLFAELDVKRSLQIVQNLKKNHQIFITATDLADLRNHGLKVDDTSIRIIDAGGLQVHG